ALLNDPAGRLYTFETARDFLDPLDFTALPAWAERLNSPSQVATLEVERWPLSAGGTSGQKAMLARCAKDFRGAPPGGLESVGYDEAGASIQCIGVFPSLEAAASAVRVYEKRGIRTHPSTRAAASMSGTFSFGGVTSGDRNAWLRRPDGATQA